MITKLPVKKENCSLAYQLATLARKSGLSAYICSDVRSYRRLSEEVAFFLQDDAQRLLLFPAWEILPYDRVSPHHGIVAERLALLSRLLHVRDTKNNLGGAQGLLLTSLPAWLQRLPPPDIISRHVWQVKVGDVLDISSLQQRLAAAGMVHVDRVQQPGEFAARGGLLDVWPGSQPMPLRLDMFGDTIDGMRRFDPHSQRSLDSLQKFTTTPAREVILDETGCEQFIAAFTARFPHRRDHPMLRSIQAGRPHPGIESLLPLVYEKTARLVDYLPSQSNIYASTDIEEVRVVFAQQIRKRFEILRQTSEPAISPQELYAIETPINAQTLELQNNNISTAAPSLDDFSHTTHPLQALKQVIESYIAKDWQILLVGHGHGQRERMMQCFPKQQIRVSAGMHDMQAGIQATMGFLDSGLMLPKAQYILLTGRELMGQKISRKRRSAHAKKAVDVFADLRELQMGNIVVHEEHGIGRYQGLEAINHGDSDDDTADFLRIEYDGGVIFVPVEDLDRLHRYGGDDSLESIKISKLGGKVWKRTRERIERDILAIAHDIIAIHAQRQQVVRASFSLVGETRNEYEDFSALFPFEETDDQARAINDTLADLSSPTLMDRVLCGDVGFGKTEIAMRATFVVANSGKQVAILAPTTVLANQHFSAFRERFAATGMEVGLLSRLQSAAESRILLEKLIKGNIDILIGTHRLLSADVKFCQLGLVVVDEEHRFGVKQKEKLKRLHAQADLLTMTATPIPRTLNQTLSSLRQVSIISTPPAEREAIRTIVAEYNSEMVQEAIRRELYRGGQVYYLHNHVRSIERVRKNLQNSIPEAEIGVAHGQMTPADLERQMLAFYEGRLSVLLCTTIIESGLDVPNANTLIVERADLLGLAQLHQLRGRVGRSHHQAYAYLFTPDARAITKDAKARLDAIATHSDLGAGFALARQDMEIRGSGNLLGESQSGHIHAIGLDLYLDMLTDAVDAAKGETPVVVETLDLQLSVSATLPVSYIPQTGERLQLYRRLASISDDETADSFYDEMRDRFGRMPKAASMAVQVARIRWRAKKLAVTRLYSDKNTIRIHFVTNNPLNITALIMRVQKDPKHFQLRPDSSLRLLGDFVVAETRLLACKELLDQLLSDIV
ncbi:MAG: transcription-repair coupling factor [Mariprofundales bacterium]